jgi:radical SAM superfamily enzyme YgiQ (UPF0313 family)
MYKLVFCYPSFDKENEGTEMLYSPLALAYMAAHTPDNYEISLVDEYVGEDLNPHTVEADLIAFSPLSSGINRAYELAAVLRARGITCVVGGAHATALPEEAGQHFDAVIQGEGEIPWKEFLTDFERATIKPIYFGKMNVSLENLGVPDRRCVHPNYHYPSLMTSRGCPFQCSFCYLSVYKNRKYRTIPHETVLADMESVKDSGLVIITDENFIGYSAKDYEDRKALLRKMIDRKFKFIWGCQASTNIAEQPELMKLMYQAGCRGVFVGFEANDEEALRSINKKHNLNVDYKDIVKKIHKQKIVVIASTILGMDNQRSGYHKTLIKELKRIKVDYVRVFYMTAWPGTTLYKELAQEGRAPSDWSSLRKDIPTTKFKHYSHPEIIEARKAIMSYFFGKRHFVKVISIWIFRDTSLLSLFLKLWWRNKSSEKIRNKRAYHSAVTTVGNHQQNSKPSHKEVEEKVAI